MHTMELIINKKKYKSTYIYLQKFKFLPLLYIKHKLSSWRPY